MIKISGTADFIAATALFERLFIFQASSHISLFSLMSTHGNIHKAGMPIFFANFAASIALSMVSLCTPGIVGISIASF